MPWMAPLDVEARRAVARAVTDTGTKAVIEVVPASVAFLKSALWDVRKQLTETYIKSHQVGLPVIIVNGRIISFGVPEVTQIRLALNASKGRNEPQGEENE